MSINLELIGNCLIALFLYNIIIKAFVQMVLNKVFENDSVKEVKKTFKEQLKEKLNKQDKQG